MSPVFGVGNSFEQRGALWTVGEDEDPLSPVRCSNIGSSYACPSCVIPERGQVAEYSPESAAPDRRDVLHDDELGLQNANALDDAQPQSTTRPLRNAQCQPRGQRN